MVPCADLKTALRGVDVVTTLTAAKKHAVIVHNDCVSPGLFINDVGGAYPGKTELDAADLARAKLVVEYKKQTLIEGEVQQHIDPKNAVYAELWEIITDQLPGRENADEVIVFDSVGFALEDYAILKYVYS